MTETEWKEIAVGTGFAEIVNNRVTLIVDTAEKPEDIDVRRAREAERAGRRTASSEAEYSAVLSYAGFAGKSNEPTASVAG